MPRNWTDTLAERKEGLAPGFVGSDESIEAFTERTAAAEREAREAEQAALDADRQADDDDATSTDADVNPFSRLLG